MSSSRLFDAYRTIGLVCDEVPFALNLLGRERFATVSIGRSFMVYDLDKLTVRLVSPPSDSLRRPISALAATGETTFVASGADVVEWRRVHEGRRLLEGASRGLGAVVSMLVFGKSLVVVCAGPASAPTAGKLAVLDIAKGKVKTIVALGGARSPREHEQGSDVPEETGLGAEADVDAGPWAFTPTCVVHPETYLNKVLVGSAEGALELWNLRTGKRVFRFRGFGAAVLCAAQSPAVDVVGLGLADGRVVLHNLRLDQTVMTLTHEGGCVTCLSFRTDAGGAGNAGNAAGNAFPALVSGSASGELAVWNLAERRLASVIRDAHDGSVVRAAFLPGEPLLVTTGVDNALKMFIFDQADGKGRLLKSRTGHKAPPTRIRYYGGDTLSTLSSGADAACCHILSAGRDRAFRIFHTARDQLNRELSQGSLVRRSRALDVKVDALKLPPVIDFAATEARERDWCNVLSAHSGEGACFTWQLENRALGTKALRPDGDAKGGALSLKAVHADGVTRRAAAFPAALCVAISTCGNFGVVGTADGTVFRYNMQSGLPRGSYPRPAARHLSKAQKKARRAKRRRLDPASVGLFPGLEDSVDATGAGAGAGAGGATSRPDADVHAHEAAQAVLRHPDRHDGPVRGVGVDALNEVLMSAGFDGKLKFWDFSAQELLGELDLGSPVAQMTLNRDAGLLAVACDDMRVRVVDVGGRRVVRTFAGHVARITDLALSKDARWLATAGADTSLRVWDLPTARCVDWMQFPRPVTGVTFSPTGEFLATTFADSVGISLWASKTHFGAARADTIARKPKQMHVPSPGIGSSSAVVDYARAAAGDDVDVGPNADADADVDAAQPEKEGDGDGDGAEDESEKRLDAAARDGELCFSGDPASKWYALAHLDLIKERNKPAEPAEKPERAPFFLPTTQGVNPVFKAPGAAADGAGTGAGTGAGAGAGADAAADAVFASVGDWGDEDADGNEDEGVEDEGVEEEEEEEQKEKAAKGGAFGAGVGESRIIKSTGFARPRSELFTLLEECHARWNASDAGSEGSEGSEGSDCFEAVAAHLKTLSPSAVDFELQSMSLGAEDDDGGHLLLLAMDWILHELNSKTNFEMVQAVLKRVVALHAASIAGRPELRKRLQPLRDAQSAAWKDLRSLLQHNLCLLSFFAHQV